MRKRSGDIIQYDQVDRSDKIYRPGDVSEPGTPPGNSDLEGIGDNMDPSSAKVIPDSMRVVAGLGFVYHYTDFEGALGILQTGVIRPTTNFGESFKARGMEPGVSLSRRSDTRRYGAVRFTFDMDVVRQRHAVQPFEFGLATRADMPQFTNAEEVVKGPLKIYPALRRIDVLEGITYRRNNGPEFIERVRSLTSVPVMTHAERIIPPAHRLAATGKTLGEILSHVSPGMLSSKVSVRPFKFDPDKGFWTWVATGSKGDRYVVRLKGLDMRPGGVLEKAPIRCSCTCPFWRWQGPEHWAKANGYLYRSPKAKPQGSMSFPKIKDPDGKNWVCKHLAAVLAKARSFKFASDLALGSSTFIHDPEPSPSRVAVRVARERDPKQTAISILQDAPDEDVEELIEMAMGTASLYDPSSRAFVPGSEVAEWLRKLKPQSEPTLSGLHVYHATSRQIAQLLLRRGFIPETKPRGIGEYAPGKGLDVGLYVGSSPRAVESYGRVTLELTVPQKWLSVPSELSQLGEDDPIRALRSHDGAVINRPIPAQHFRILA